MPFEVRTACEQLGQILALRIESIIENNDWRTGCSCAASWCPSWRRSASPSEFVHNMSSASQDLLMLWTPPAPRWCSRDDTILFGSTPPRREVDALVDWLGAGSGELIHSDYLARDFPPPGPIPSGQRHAGDVDFAHPPALCDLVSPGGGANVEWAGNPAGKGADLEQGGGQAAPLTPRKSFEVWRETMRGTSTPWQRSELEVALEFRSAILGIVLARAEEMAEPGRRTRARQQGAGVVFVFGVA